jgi:hypothetical protein
MSLLNSKRTPSSLAPPLFYAGKQFVNKEIEGTPFADHDKASSDVNPVKLNKYSKHIK